MVHACKHTPFIAFKMQSYAFLINYIVFKELNVMKRSCGSDAEVVQMCLVSGAEAAVLSSFTERERHRSRPRPTSFTFAVGIVRVR